MAILERLGYWVLVLFSVEVLVLFGLLWKRTGILFFKQWLHRLSWILPLHLWLAYLVYDTSLDPRAIHSFLDYNHFMARLLVRDTEILLARLIHYLTAAIAVLSVLPAIVTWFRRKWGMAPAISPPCAGLFLLGTHVQS